MTTVADSAETRERLVLESSALDGRSAPSRVLIAPWGQVTSANGMFVMDDEAAALVIKAFAEHGTDLPIDYEHQSLGGSYASPSGQAPAAGWIRQLELVTADQSDKAGLFGEVQWTAGAEEKLAAREYRYLSPVVIVRKRDRRVVALHSAALTNKPAIAGMQPIVNRAEGDVEGNAIRKEPNREGDEIVVSSAGVEALRDRLGLDVSVEGDAVLAAAAERLASLVREQAERDAVGRVEAAMKAGKLTPAQREWAAALAMSDAEAFEQYVASAPVVVTTGRTAPPRDTGDRRRAAVIASAKRSYRDEPALAMLTDEAAYVQNALREAGFKNE
jgi:phage I-like protein